MSAVRVMLSIVYCFAIFAPRDGRGQEGVQASPPEPAGYRTENYRAPTPATLAGARVLSTVAAERLWRDKAAVFVDVLPHAPRPANLPPGTIWRDKPRRDIPGSLWLPDTGYGELASVTQDYLRTNIERATGGDRTKLIVVYCLRDCWMSWNAAKRILSMGNANVAWYPDGTDGWTDMLLPLAEAQPAPPIGN
jgi:PQQ-dependent catabolism-associated CXXCW motif protein